jgi:hypothetical protein
VKFDPNLAKADLKASDKGEKAAKRASKAKK